MLARLKLSYADIRDAIWNIDDEKLNIDNLKAIKQYIPTKEEVNNTHKCGDMYNLSYFIWEIRLKSLMTLMGIRHFLAMLSDTFAW
jgi:hypothetical protein